MPVGRVESVWLRSNWTAAGGVDRGPPLPIVRATFDSRLDDFVLWETCTVVVPLEAPALTGLADNDVLKVYRVDAAPDPPTADYMEYRILRIEKDLLAGTITLTGTYWLDDLVRRNFLMERLDAIQTITLAVSSIQTAIPGTIWDPGTTPSSSFVTVIAGAHTALEWLRKVVASVYEVDGVAYEIYATRDGDSGLLVNVGALNASARFDVRERTNLTRLVERRDLARIANRIYPAAADGFRRATYLVSAVTASTWVEITPYTGDRGAAREDDQFDLVNQYVVVEWKNGTSHAITNTTKIDDQTTRLAVASTTTLVAGDLVFLALDASPSPEDIPFVDGPASLGARDTWLKLEGGDDSITNLAGVNADMNDWTGSRPAGWSGSGTAPTKNTLNGTWRYGGQSATYAGVSSATLVAPSRTAYARAGEILQYGIAVKIGSFGAHLFRFTNPNTGASEDVLLDGTVPGLDRLGEWLWYTRDYVITTTGAKNLLATLLTAAGGGTTTWDAVAYYWMPIARAPDFRMGSGAARNLARANRVIDTDGSAILSYEVGVTDRSQVDRRFAANRPLIGATAVLTSEGLGATDVPQRVVQLAEAAGAEAQLSIQVANMARRLTRQIARQVTG